MATPTDYTERLHAAMRMAGLDPDDSAGVHTLSRALNCTYQAAKKALDGGTKMLTAENNVVAAHFLRVDSEWLATGQGSPRSDRVWPLTRELLEACRSAPEALLRRAENAARIALDMPALDAAPAVDPAAKAFIQRVSVEPPVVPAPPAVRSFRPKTPLPSAEPPAASGHAPVADPRAAAPRKRAKGEREE